MHEPLRWGVIGTGAIAAAWVDDMGISETGTVVAVGSRKLETAERFGERWKIPNRHPSYEALVGDPEVDAVYVATPHPLHSPCSQLALRAGKPVLVEKPFTANAAQARELVAIARAERRFLMEAMWTRWLPHIVQIRGLLEQGALGRIVTVTADHGQWFPSDSSFRAHARELHSGALLDLGVYPVSFASMVLGPPEQVRSLVTPAPDGGDDQTSMIFGYADGAHALLNASLSGKSPTRGAIVGTQARIEIDGDFYRPSSFSLIATDGTETRYDVAHEGWGLRHQADEVARCLREGLLESPVMALDESISIMATMDEVLAQGRR
jgi:predicted dehydrogenase